MTQFWLAEFDIDPSLIDGPEPSRSVAPLLAGFSATGSARSRIVVEVIRDEQPDRIDCALLLSTCDERTGQLTCRIGFNNSPNSCTVWRDRGFPLFDATMEFTESLKGAGNPGSLDLNVVVGHFLASTDIEAMQYQTALLSVIGVQFETAERKALQGDAAANAVYRQEVVAPDVANPKDSIALRPLEWYAQRVGSRISHDHARLVINDSRFPGMAPLRAGQTIQGTRAYAGRIELTDKHQRSSLGAADFDRPARRPRRDFFGVPAFRFEDVEVIGFRIDLDADDLVIRDTLSKIVAPLNFHLDRDRGEMSDFCYRVGSRTLLIELLRYGKMKLDPPDEPLRDSDFQSQHELLVRVLVGRVDDDSAQARDPAVYVPAIFVDNPWSKALGRDVQGFDKRLAKFCANGSLIPLRPDGRAPLPASEIKPPPERLETRPVPFSQIDRVFVSSATDSIAESHSPQAILEIDCSSASKLDDWDDFLAIDLNLALGSASLSSLRWRQTDFDQAEFRRSFAREVMARSTNGFRSVQVSPVSKEIELAKTWINGTFVFNKMRVAQPSGITSLTLRSHDDAHEAWNALCELLSDGEKEAQLSFARGEWYRLKCSMTLTIDDGLALPDGA